MSFDCKFHCIDHPNKIKFNRRHYQNGGEGGHSMYDGDRVSQCTICDIFFTDMGKNCPCCGVNMRKYGRSKAFKRKREGLVKRY